MYRNWPRAFNRTAPGSGTGSFEAVFNVTGGSVAATLLFHTSLNLSTFALFPVFEHQESLPFYTGLILVAAIVVVIVGGPRRLGRRN